MKIYFYSGLILICIFWNSIYAQDSLNIPKKNTDIFSDLTIKNLDILRNRLVVLGSDKLYTLKFEKEYPGIDFFTQEVRKNLFNFKIISSENINSDYEILIGNLNFKTEYLKKSDGYLSNQKVKRNISAEFNFTIKKNIGDTLLFSGSRFEKYTDNINIEDVEKVEKNSYDFMKGVLPEQSFMNKIFVPAIAIAATLITIVLFYVIRSK
jgi:hypothetical protein